MTFEEKKEELEAELLRVYRELPWVMRVAWRAWCKVQDWRDPEREKFGAFLDRRGAMPPGVGKL